MAAEGKYHGILKQGVVGLSQASNVEQVELTFDITHQLGEDQQWHPIASMERTIFLSLSDNSWQYTEAKLKALGFNGDFRDMQFGEGPRAEGVELLCQHEEYQGKKRERWELANWSSREVRPAGDDKLRRLNAKWKASAGSAPATSGRPAPPPAAASAAPATPAAPAPAAAAPATPAATTPPYADEGRSFKTKDEAWGFWLECSSNAPDLTKWAEAVKAIGKDESEFTADDWNKVAAAGCPI